jgi:hypothetical protein
MVAGLPYSPLPHPITYACFLFSEMKIQLNNEDLIVNHRGCGEHHETGVLEVLPTVREALTTVCKFPGGLL